MKIGSISSILPFTIKPKDNTSVGNQMDRDANTGGGTNAQPRKPTPEEVIEAIAYLKNLQGIKDNNLQVRLSEADGIRVIFIEDLKGKIVRRIPEMEIPSLLEDRSRTKGQLIDRAM